MTYKIINNCRVCNKKVTEILNLNDQPFANGFCKKSIKQKKYPLKLMLCTNCWHTQLSIVIDPKLLFSIFQSSN